MRYQFAKPEDCREELKSAVAKAVEECKGIFVYGNTGVGKTHFCHAVANSKKVPVENFVELLSEFKDYIQRGCYMDHMKTLCNAEYLIIDDLGSEKTSEWVHEFLYTIINKRYENQKRTIITTNLQLSAFKDRYGERILSRLAEMCVVVELLGEDLRLK